jgi:hypothetical protein
VPGQLKRLWVVDRAGEGWRRHTVTGDVIIVRYADDFIIGFEYEPPRWKPYAGMYGSVRRRSAMSIPYREFGKMSAGSRL